MLPAISPGDRVMVDLRSYRNARPRPSDLVVVKRQDADALVVRRLIATGGMTISGKKGAIYLDAAPIDEPYVQHEGSPLPQLVDFGPIQIPPGKLFVMGDNRDISLDSRMAQFGLVDESAVMGRVLYTLTSRR